MDTSADPDRPWLVLTLNATMVLDRLGRDHFPIMWAHDARVLSDSPNIALFQKEGASREFAMGGLKHDKVAFFKTTTDAQLYTIARAFVDHALALWPNGACLAFDDAGIGLFRKELRITDRDAAVQQVVDWMVISIVT